MSINSTPIEKECSPASAHQASKSFCSCGWLRRILNFCSSSWLFRCVISASIHGHVRPMPHESTLSSMDYAHSGQDKGIFNGSILFPAPLRYPHTTTHQSPI